LAESKEIVVRANITIADAIAPGCRCDAGFAKPGRPRIVRDWPDKPCSGTRIGLAGGTWRCGEGPL
jgi:hypothetical protein